MIKYDTTQKRWIDTEDPAWIFETERRGMHFQQFPDEFVEGSEPPEAFKTLKEFCGWLSGYSLKHTSIGMTCSPITVDGVTYPFFWQINLHPLVAIGGDEFPWGVRIADSFVYWYHAHQYAQRIDKYMDDVLEEARRELDEGKSLQS
jgi:hypothetical protein